VAGNVRTPETSFQRAELQSSLDCWLKELTAKQRDVLCRRFGLKGYNSDTLENVGFEIGLTRERVRQIQIEALKQLKQIMRRGGVVRELILDIA
jgi:RNA polymerase nonessential primary-like sigma factor